VIEVLIYSVLECSISKQREKMNQKSKFLGLFIVLLLIGLSCGSSAPQKGSPIPTVVEAPAVTVEVQAPPAPVENTAEPLDYAGTLARDHLAYISQVIGARPCGSDQEARTVEYISETLTTYGYQVELQPFEFYDEDEGEMRSTNIMAVRKGISPQEIIVGAHYDSSKRGEGADDNASGVAVLLELAMRLQTVETPYSVRFIAFGAEENGMEGSYYYVVHLSPEEIDNIAGMINLDSVIAGDYLYIYSNVEVDGTLQEKLVDEDTPGIDYIGMTLEELDMSGEYPCECSDYQPFSEAGIPFVYIEATNWEMGDKDGYTQTQPEYGNGGGIIHTEYDTLAYFDQVFPGRVDQQLRFMVAELYDLLVNDQ
jgi:alkaline phosphatase isozyme conversion protein